MNSFARLFYVFKYSVLTLVSYFKQYFSEILTFTFLSQVFVFFFIFRTQHIASDMVHVDQCLYNVCWIYTWVAVAVLHRIDRRSLAPELRQEKVLERFANDCDWQLQTLIFLLVGRVNSCKGLPVKNVLTIGNHWDYDLSGLRSMN